MKLQRVFRFHGRKFDDSKWFSTKLFYSLPKDFEFQVSQLLKQGFSSGVDEDKYCSLPYAHVLALERGRVIGVARLFSRCIVCIPFIFYAFIKSWPRVVSWAGRFIWKTSDSKEVSARLMQSVMMSVLAANVFFGGSPISLQFWFKNLKPAPFRTQNFHYSSYKWTGRDRQLERLVSLIPDSSIVSTQQFLAPRLYRKRAVMMFPITERENGDFRADFILYDATNNGLSQESPAYVRLEYFEAVEKDPGNWRFIEREGSFFLFQRIKS